MGSAAGWRSRAKLAVRRQCGRTVLGLFRAGSHEVVPIPGCPAHHPSINRAIEFLAGLPPDWAYDEPSATGQLRYVQATADRLSGRVQLALVLNLPAFDCHDTGRWITTAESWFSSKPELWHSVWLNLQPRPTNTIFGPLWMHVAGERFLWETVCGCAIPSTPAHFRQANLELFEQAVNDIALRLDREATILELYAGMGVISLILSRHCSGAIAVDREGYGQEAFELAKDQLPPPAPPLRFEARDAAHCLDLMENVSTLVVDPTRKGLPQAILEKSIDQRSIRSIWYLSCHFPSLERDIDLLMRGGYSIAFARSYLFFPGTDHVETLVQLCR